MKSSTICWEWILAKVCYTALQATCHKQKIIISETQNQERYSARKPNHFTSLDLNNQKVTKVYEEEQVNLRVSTLGGQWKWKWQ